MVLTAVGDGSRLALWPDQVGRAPTRPITEHAVGRSFSVAADGFWQVHPAAADTLAGAVGEALAGVELHGGAAWDLYGGVGLFSEVLAVAVGPDGSVITVEGDRTASALAATNLADRPQLSVVLGAVEEAIDELPDAVDAVVLDPPRSGAGPVALRADRVPAARGDRVRGV